MSTRIAIAALVTLGALSLGAAEPRDTPIERFAAASPLMTSAARLTLRPMEIAITRWSTHPERRALATALIEDGPLAFERLLCTYGAAGTISVAGAREVAILYAWSITEPGGNRRVYLATDTPVSLSTGWFPRPDDEPLT